MLASNMPSDSDSLFARARGGDAEAWEQLVSHCYDKIRRVVGGKLDRRMRALFDSTDFTNDVLKSLVAKSDRFDFPTLEALKSFLFKAAEQKVNDAYRKQHTQRRDVKKQHHFGELEAEGGAFDPIGHEATPSQYAQARETKERILGSHSDEDRRVLELRAEDYTNDEIVSETGLHLRKVQRLVKKVSDSWRADEERDKR